MNYADFGGCMNYADISWRRKKALPLFLELCALGLELGAEEVPNDSTGYAIEVKGLKSLSPAHADRVRRSIADNMPGLVRILMLGKWDEDLRAIREEASTA